jgi:hypothetical protein
VENILETRTTLRRAEVKSITKPCFSTQETLQVVDGHVFNSIQRCRRKEQIKTKMDADFKEKSTKPR